MPNSNKPSKAPYGSYLWFKEVEAKHRDDFKDWPVPSSVASSIGPEPKRYSAAWYDWIESRDWIEALDNVYQSRAKPEAK
jgi:hypothetical protein